MVQTAFSRGQIVAQILISYHPITMPRLLVIHSSCPTTEITKQCIPRYSHCDCLASTTFEAAKVVWITVKLSTGFCFSIEK